MKIINYFSNMAIPIIVFIIIITALKEKEGVFSLFLSGAKKGIKVVFNLFPTLIGIFMAINMLRYSGILDFFINLSKPILNKLSIPIEVMPLAILKPLSGSSAIAIGTEIMKKYGVDSKIGLIAATIMGSTETTFYVISIYSESVNINKTKFALKAALIADVVGILSSVVIWQILS